MANQFKDGSTVMFDHTPTNGAQVTLGIKSHNVDLTALLHDVTNNKHGGATARIAGKDDASGTVSAALDTDEMPHAAGFDIKPGNTGVMRFGISSTQAIQIPFIVAKLHYEASTESAVTFSFDVQMNILAGSVDYPGD